MMMNGGKTVIGASQKGISERGRRSYEQEENTLKALQIVEVTVKVKRRGHYPCHVFLKMQKSRLS